MFVQDFVQNGQGHGPVGEMLAGCHFDPGLQRPYFDSRGKSVVTVNTGRKDGKGKPIYKAMSVRNAEDQFGITINGPTSLRKNEWIRVDEAVKSVYRQRLRAWSDLLGSSTYGGFDAMGTMLLEHETMSDPGEALVDMDGTAEPRASSPLFQLEGTPLPITQAGFWYSQRRLAVSRRMGTPLSTRSAEQCTRRVAEKIEQTVIGTVTGMTYGNASDYSRNPTVYGYTNFPLRNTYTSVPTPVGTNSGAVLAAVLRMRDIAYADNMYGPFMLYTSNDWDQWLDNDYYVTSGDVMTRTLRQRIKDIDGIQDVRRLDYLSNTYTLLLVQMTPDVATAVNGMPITVTQYESQGGAKVNFKVMAIQVPLIFADYDGRCGIVHGTTS